MRLLCAYNIPSKVYGNFPSKSFCSFSLRDLSFRNSLPRNSVCFLPKALQMRFQGQFKHGSVYFNSVYIDLRLCTFNLIAQLVHTFSESERIEHQFSSSQDHCCQCLLQPVSAKSLALIAILSIYNNFRLKMKLQCTNRSLALSDQ